MRRRVELPFREKPHAVLADESGRCCVGVVSDSHGRMHPHTVELLRKEKPQLILHAGDVGRMGVLEELKAVAPVVAVRGNVDDRGTYLPEAVVLTVQARDGASVALYVTHIGVRGVRVITEIRDRARAANAAMVVCGHSHMPLIVRDGDLGIFNPGSCGPRRFGLPIVFGVIELEDGALQFRHIDCETGDRWLPPPPLPRR